MYRSRLHFRNELRKFRWKLSMCVPCPNVRERERGKERSPAIKLTSLRKSFSFHERRSEKTVSQGICNGKGRVNGDLRQTKKPIFAWNLSTACSETLTLLNTIDPFLSTPLFPTLFFSYSILSSPAISSPFLSFSTSLYPTRPYFRFRVPWPYESSLHFFSFFSFPDLHNAFHHLPV